MCDVEERMYQRANEASTTRRAIVTAVYSLLDPLGFIAPYLMKVKLLLQMLCRKGVGWDDPLQESERSQWKRWLADLPKLQAIRVDVVSNQLHLTTSKKYSYTYSQTAQDLDTLQ